MNKMTRNRSVGKVLCKRLHATVPRSLVAGLAVYDYETQQKGCMFWILNNDRARKKRIARFSCDCTIIECEKIVPKCWARDLLCSFSFADTETDRNVALYGGSALITYNKETKKRRVPLNSQFPTHCIKNQSKKYWMNEKKGKKKCILHNVSIKEMKNKINSCKCMTVSGSLSLTFWWNLRLFAVSTF